MIKLQLPRPEETLESDSSLAFGNWRLIENWLLAFGNSSAIRQARQTGIR
jgi:hypothetical protein